MPFFSEAKVLELCGNDPRVLSEWRRITHSINLDRGLEAAIIRLNELFWHQAERFDGIPFRGNVELDKEAFKFNYRILLKLNLLSQQLIEFYREYQTSTLQRPPMEYLARCNAQAKESHKTLISLKKIYTLYKKKKDTFYEYLFAYLFMGYGLLSIFFKDRTETSPSPVAISSFVSLGLTLSLFSHLLYRYKSTLPRLIQAINTQSRAFRETVDEHSIAIANEAASLTLFQERNVNWVGEGGYVDIKSDATKRLSEELNHLQTEGEYLHCPICLDEDENKFTLEDLQHPDTSIQQPIFTLILSKNEEKPFDHFSGPYHLTCLTAFEKIQIRERLELLDPKTGTHDVDLTPRRKHFEFFMFAYKQRNETIPNAISPDEISVDICEENKEEDQELAATPRLG